MKHFKTTRSACGRGSTSGHCSSRLFRLVLGFGIWFIRQ